VIGETQCELREPFFSRLAYFNGTKTPVNIGISSLSSQLL
jgi:hypothetical protein